MTRRIKRWLFGKLAILNRWREAHDLCEICHEEQACSICVGCEQRICCECTSGYYADEDLCLACRAQITPEEEEADRLEQIQADMEDECNS